MNKFTGILLGCLLALAGFAAQAAPYTTATYYGLDATDSPVVAMNQAGTVIWRKTYAPYGKASNKDQDNRIGYTGHVENANGLVDAGARHYDPALGVFTSDDPVRFDENNPASFNRYAYANNNPYKFVDPDGRHPALLALAGLAKAADMALTAAEVYTAAETGGASAAAVVAAESAVTSVVPGGKTLSKIVNKVPQMLARVIPGKGDFPMLGPPSRTDVFVTAADDIAGLNAKQIAERLTIQEKDSFTVIRFPSPTSGIASPVNRIDPGFVGGGRTAGGAREFVLPNGPIPSDSTSEVIGL